MARVDPWTMAPKGWLYTGDMNLEHGGLFVHMAQYQAGETSVDVVEVRPDSDRGGADNVFHVQPGVLYTERDNWDTILAHAGVRMAVIGGLPVMVEDGLRGPADYQLATTPAALLRRLEALHHYLGAEESGPGYVVRVGRPDDLSAEPTEEPDTILRAGTSLARWVIRECVRG